MIALHILRETAKEELVVHHADVGLLAVHDLDRQKDEFFSLIPATMWCQGSRLYRSFRLKVSVDICTDFYSKEIENGSKTPKLSFIIKHIANKKPHFVKKITHTAIAFAI